MGSLLVACMPEEVNDLEADTDMNVPTSPPPANSWWRPEPGLSWQWQLTGKFDFDVQTDVYDIDLDVHESAVEHFHNQGAKVICYISVGSHENWRKDS